MARKKAILIGFGSIGKVHFQTAVHFYDEIIVVDTDSEKLDECNALSKELNFKATFSQNLDQLADFQKFDVCIIANWGPDHFTTFEHLVGLGCKSFIIEKPLTSRLSDLYKLRILCDQKELKVITNLQSNFSHFREVLAELTLEFGLGEVLGFQVSGGAKCVATNGIHYLALANQVFNEWPTHVIADLKSDLINPRGHDLAFLGGVANWNYTSGKNVSMHFHNNSHLNVNIRLLFKYGYMEVINNTYSLFGIDLKDRQRFTKPAHTSSATTLLRTGDAFETLGRNAPIHNLYSEFINSSSPQILFDAGYHATKGILGALISSSTGKRVDLETYAFGYAEYLETDWQIS